MASGIGLTGTLFMGARSLATQRIAIEVTGHNLANVNTPNAARQRLNIVTDSSINLGAGQQGLGSVPLNIESLRNQLLDDLVVRQTSLSGLYDARRDLLALVQDAMGESLSTSETTATEGASSATGLQASLNKFFDAWQGLTDRPDSLIAREEVINRTKNLAADIKSAYDRIMDAKNGVFEQATSITGDINNLASQIADLNNQIAKVEVNTQTRANDLRDRRQELVENMSKLVNITVELNPANNTMLDISLTDAPATLLVNGAFGAGAGAGASASNRLDVAALNPTTSNVEPGNVFNRTTNSMMRIIATNSTTAPVLAGGAPIPPANVVVTPLEGELGANLTVSNTDIGSGHAVVAAPATLVEKINKFANDLITLVNGIQNPTAAAPPETFTLDGTPTDGTAAFNLLAGTNALTIAINFTDPTRLAAARNATGTTFPGALDASNAQLMSALRDNVNLGLAYRSTVADLGAQAQQSERNQQAQELIQQQIMKQRESVSGISVDEEMTNMISYQRAFEASARFINVIDELLISVINIAN